MGIALYCWSPLLDSSLVWFYLAITSYSSRVWRRVVDAIHGEYFDNSRNRHYYRFDLCWAHWFRYRCWTRIHAEQIDAMEVSGTNPFKYLVVTRIMATTLMLPILVFLRCYCSFRIVSGWKYKRARIFLLYFNQVFNALNLRSDPANQSFAIGLVGCFRLLL
jgi:hypothetical protein